VVQVILNALENGEVVAVFCKLGKDRTGLLTMLVLSCCGATDAEIVSDYIRSACEIERLKK
jgi:protein tyrosine/serine phosphatase